MMKFFTKRKDPVPEDPEFDRSLSLIADFIKSIPRLKDAREKLCLSLRNHSAQQKDDMVGLIEEAVSVIEKKGT